MPPLPVNSVSLAVAANGFASLVPKVAVLLLSSLSLSLTFFPFFLMYNLWETPAWARVASRHVPNFPPWAAAGKSLASATFKLLRWLPSIFFSTCMELLPVGYQPLRFHYNLPFINRSFVLFLVVWRSSERRNGGRPWPGHWGEDLQDRKHHWAQMRSEQSARPDGQRYVAPWSPVAQLRHVPWGH